MIKQKCLTCGKEFSARESEIKRGKGKYCSYKCSGASGGEAYAKTHSQLGEQNPAWKGGISKEFTRYKKNYNSRHPLATKAHRITDYALKSGRLVKEPCSICGTENNLHAHHSDYNKPLEVTWLCDKHHRISHGASS